MQGLHLTADLRGCSPALPVMTDTAALRTLCVDAVRAVGLTPVGELFHRFEPAAGCGGITGRTVETPGITGVVLLAESHLAVHTWPELAAVTLDVYVCNFGADNSARADVLLQRLEAAFEAQTAQRQRLERGRP